MYKNHLHKEMCRNHLPVTYFIAPLQSAIDRTSPLHRERISQYPSFPHLLNISCSAFGNVTSGTITVLRALGAFFGAWFLSPCG